MDLDLLQLTCDLMAFPSVSTTSNAAVSDFLLQILQKDGFQTERLTYVDAAGVSKVSVVGKKGNGSGGLAYFGHSDVVPATTWTGTPEGPFNPVVRDGRLYGRGSCDMKGSVAAFLIAARKLSAEALHSPIYFICTADEEVGFHGARDVTLRSQLYAELVNGGAVGLIGEPTELQVVHAHKGGYGFRVTSRGRAAHSSTREGVNANLAMIPFLSEMKAIHDETLHDPRWNNSEFDPPWISWNIGINDHTGAVNITPPQSICTVAFRPMPGQQPQQLVDRAQACAEKWGLQFESLGAFEPLYTNPDSDWIRELVALSQTDRSHTVAFGTDGSLFTQMTELAVLGPGSIRQAHTDDEFISLEQLRGGADLYERILKQRCARA